MSKKFPEKRIRHSEQVYRVFRQAVIRDDGVYSKQLFDDGLVGSREDANRLLTALKERGILEKGKRTRAQFYIPDWEGISLYSEEILDSSSPIPENFLKKYIANYVENVMNSSLLFLLREDLITSLNAYARSNDLPPDLNLFLESIGEDAEKYDRKLIETVIKALET